MLRLILVVLALSFCALADIVEKNANDPEAREMLKLLLDELKSKEEVTKITRYAIQVGFLREFYFTYETKSGKTCEGSYLIRPWMSSIAQFKPVVENKCT